METYENNKETIKMKKRLTELFLKDDRVHDFSDWVFVDGLVYCGKCYKLYPNCLGNCRNK